MSQCYCSLSFSYQSSHPVSYLRHSGGKNVWSVARELWDRDTPVGVLCKVGFPHLLWLHTHFIIVLVLSLSPWKWPRMNCSNRLNDERVQFSSILMRNTKLRVKICFFPVQLGFQFKYEYYDSNTCGVYWLVNKGLIWKIFTNNRWIQNMDAPNTAYMILLLAAKSIICQISALYDSIATVG